LKEQITKAVLALLRGEEMMRQISGYLTDSLAQFRPHSIDSIMRALHPESEEKLKSMLSRGLLNVVASEDTSKIINSMLATQIDNLLSAPIGRLSDNIAEDRLLAASEGLAEAIIAAIREKLPEAIKEFDVGGVVREKINAYPIEKLESLVLSVAKDHLRKIELFGAILGLFLGIGQALVVYFAFLR
jgi:uncharacterized membrane protein YheB (UPF0754 family)